MTELHETRLKRLRMRSWRRGIKEMDLILGPFADSRLPELTPAQLDSYERLLGENDQDLYKWASGQSRAPAPLESILEEVTIFHRYLRQSAPD